MKSILNGVPNSNFLSLRTLMSKILGLTLARGSGLYFSTPICIIFPLNQEFILPPYYIFLLNFQVYGLAKRAPLYI